MGREGRAGLQEPSPGPNWAYAQRCGRRESSPIRLFTNRWLNRHWKGKMKGHVLPPKPAAMIEALRDIGYSLEAAVADVIDNSLTAGARSVRIRYGWELEKPWLAILDDGSGMSDGELVEAMRPGSRDPRDLRGPDDLGRFGLGLKTASFSQCRCLTVISRKDGTTSGRRWDLNEVSRRNEWLLLTVSDKDFAALPAFEEFRGTGTYVLWQAMDRLDLGPYGEHAHSILNERLDQVRRHLALVFHRFASPEPGYRRVRILINGNEIEPFEPFNARNPATQHLPEERVRVGDDEVLIQPYVLPHHTKVTPAEYEKYASDDGYLRSQGFYVYRSRRLIRYGTWFRLCRQEELTKLARVKIDMPNSLDHLWTIDVRKSRASPPETVRSRMRQVVEKIRGSARRPYTHRGEIIQNRTTTAVWERRVFNDRISYEVNWAHPLVEDLRSDLDEILRHRFDLVLRLISSSFPAPLVFSDMGTTPRKVESTQPDEALLLDLARMMRDSNPRADIAELQALLLSTEPFASWPQATYRVIAALAKDI